MSDAQQIAERLAKIAESVSSVTLDTAGWEPYGSPQGLYLHRLKEAFEADAGMREAVEHVEAAREMAIRGGGVELHLDNALAALRGGTITNPKEATDA